jgi:hypothetical protein
LNFAEKNKKRLIPMDEALFEKRKFALASASLATFSASTAVAAPAPAPAAVAAASITATPAATWRTRLARTRFIDGKRPALNRFAVELGDGVLSLLVRAHGDEGKTARFAGKFVLHQHDLLHRPGLGEEFLQFVFGRVEGKISYV